MSHTIEQSKGYPAPSEPVLSATVHGQDAFAYADCGEAALIQSQGLARIRGATSAIQTIVAMLMQREQDADCQGEGRLLLDGQHVEGLLNALAICAESIEEGVCGKSPYAQVFKARSDGLSLVQSAAMIARQNPDLGAAGR